MRRAGRPSWRGYAVFGVMLGLAAAVRAVAMLAYWGVLWFPDSNSYLAVAVEPQQYPVRPVGYSFFLRLLEPLHSFAAVAIAQHLMGLAIGALIYLTLRVRFGVRQWLSLLAAAPVLFHGYQIQLEHMLLSDVLFEFVVVVAVTLVLWWPDGRWSAAFAGLCLGLAAATRSIALPLLVIFVVYLVVRRRWWRVVLTAGVCAVPVVAYALWFHAAWGVYSMTNSSGIFLYGRVMAFADCSRIHPPADERKLCTTKPPAERGPSPNWIWHTGYFGPFPNNEKFSVAHDQLAGDFARRAILAQPGDYLMTGLNDLARTFWWDRPPYPTKYSTRLYEFLPKPDPLDMKARPVPGETLGHAVHTYLADPAADGLARVNPQYAHFMIRYQDIVDVHGTILLPIVAGGGIMLLVRRRPVAHAALPWLCAVALLVTPPFVSAFGYRYVIPAIPLACLALALTFGPGPPRPARVDAEQGGGQEKATIPG